MRLPDSVVFIQVLKRDNSYPPWLRSGSNIDNWQESIQHDQIRTQEPGVFSLQKSSDDGKTASKTILLSTPNKEFVLDQNTSVATSVYVCVPSMSYSADKRELGFGTSI